MRARGSFWKIFVRGKWQVPILLGVWLLSACTLPTSGGGRPTCRPEELRSPPEINYPADNQLIDNLSPTFTWEWRADCNPQHFLIEVYGPSSAVPAFVSERIPGDTLAWDLDGRLQPASTYTWRLTPRTMGSVGPVSSTHIFMTGPVCSELSASSYPEPHLLSPLDGTVISEASPIHTSDGHEYPNVSFYMAWDDPSDCLPGGYHIQVSRSPTFPASSTLDFYQDNRTLMLFFFPPGLPEGLSMHDCTRYYWHVQAALPDSTFSEYSEIWSFLINTGDLVCAVRPVVSPLPPSLPLPVPSATETPPLLAPSARALQNSNCRFGPGRAFPITSTLFEGQSAPIQGRNEDGSWLWIQNPQGSGGCWIWNETVEVTGDLSLLPIIQSPPTPTPTTPPKPTKTPKGSEGANGCWVFNQNLQKKICVAPCPPNPNPGGACNP